MRIAFIGHEAFANLALALLENGHELTHIFCAERSRSALAVRMADVQKRAGVPVRWGLIGRPELEEIHRSGAEMILCASYPRRLPVRPDDPVPSVNVHIAPLPEGRGPAPLEWAILTGREETAVTIHEMVERFDSGPILYQRPLSVSAKETATSLEFRGRDLAAKMVIELAANFHYFWADRRPQGAGTYCKLYHRPQRTIDARENVEQTDRMLRAFSAGGTFVRASGRELTVLDAVCWAEEHEYEPGALIAQNQSRYLFALPDGFLYVRNAVPPWEGRLRAVRSRLPAFLR